MQQLFVSRYVTTPKAELNRSRALSKTSPKPFTTRGRVHSTVPRAASGPGFARAPMRACGCSLWDYEHVCAGQSHAPTVSSATPRALRPQRLCHCLLCHRNGMLQPLLRSPTHKKGKMSLQAIKGQQGGASQVRF